MSGLNQQAPEVCTSFNMTSQLATPAGQSVYRNSSSVVPKPRK